ncbi:hypothetical protein PUNSTDRAFT_29795, partial [Punctularia strigosozonata HHB-11173 SS5]|uniref:uncharacterized protein n=1 Tax=Punctularia strigosozonata (strain HHB-11173) TaxID=741275 RepID=UPI00044175E7
APGTLKGYSSVVNRYLQFCKLEHIPREDRFPAPEVVLCAFAARAVGRLAGGTARSWMAGLKAWHTAHDAPWLGGERLQQVLKGVENSRPRDSHKPPRKPITRDMLRQLHKKLRFDSPLDAAVFAAACCMFWGQFRAGELLPNSQSAFQDHLPKRSDFHKPARASASYSIALPSSKTRYAKGETVFLHRQRGSTDPIDALAYHLHKSDLPSNSALFAFRTHGGPKLLTRSLFLARCNTIWTPLRHPRVTGHCFRIGGTTELLLAGVPPHVVKKAGRWSSDTFLRYWRSVEDILPQHMRR